MLTYQNGYEAKTLISISKEYKQNAHLPKATRRITCSYTRNSYEAKTLIYHNSYETTHFHTIQKMLRILRQNTKCQIDKKSRRKGIASFFKAPKTTHYGNLISWKSSNRKIALGRSREKQSQ